MGLTHRVQILTLTQAGLIAGRPGHEVCTEHGCAIPNGEVGILGDVGVVHHLRGGRVVAHGKSAAVGEGEHLGGRGRLHFHAI